MGSRVDSLERALLPQGLCQYGEFPPGFQG
ncbi:hypothetical protein PSOLE_11760 [Pseudomonas oleovorans subsp. oleovorans]|uniref:Uncharacterized protein n=1 Tax=Ectopseudomonas oleovorans TaxID=301 RepID=A0A379JY77_ECTOL|nr:hypothetical protein PSOLE_11760 [Pseudomonas oleovorans subsp. oleovorans]SEJ91524.1 hypothetical protein SAMN05216280_106316 [Pseudomonas oleovorans]SUD53569.1 Uncharacterised protein [Pseudomonas oleovorans]SUD59927.1 Uncharacterised protein [Pseudomonas oleovorans]